MTDIYVIMAFLQSILVLLVSFGVKKMWDNSILLASIDKEVKLINNTIRDHETRIRDLEAA